MIRGFLLAIGLWTSAPRSGRRIRIVILTAASFLILSTAATQGSKPQALPGHAQEADAGKAVLRVERARTDAVLRGDVAALERLLAEDYFVTTSFGTLGNKTKELSLYKTGTRQAQAWEPHDVIVRVYGDAAVVTQRAAFKDVLEGQVRDVQMRLTHVWIERDGRWQVVVRHGTRLIEPGPTTPMAPVVLVVQPPAAGDKPSGQSGGAEEQAFRMRDERQLRGVNSDFDEAQRTRDLASIERTLSNHFLWTTFSGMAMDRAATETHLKAGDSKYELFQSDDLRVRIYGKVGVITGRLTRKGRNSRGDLSGQLRYTRVYSKDNDNWRMVAYQVTEIAKRQ